MENSEETHYVSFLSGEGGGMGGGNSRYRRAHPSGSSPSYSSRGFKRSVLGLRLKAQLLVAAILASLFLCCFVFFWAAREGKNSAADDAADVFTPKEEDTGNSGGSSNKGDIPEKVYDWEDKHFAIAFNQFMSEHGKSYNSLREKERRFRIFKANLTHILLHNEQGHSYELGMNKFGDWTREEFKSFVNGFRQNPHSLHYSRLGASPLLTDPHSDSTDSSSSSSSGSSSGSAPLPASVDWREKGCVTPPKDQGQCGSCWAFSATGAVEGAWCIKKGSLVNLSEQMLMDCSRYLGNNGCNGGLMDDAFSYVTQKGLCSERDYPYEAKDGKCREKKCKPQIKIRGFYDVPPGDEAAMRAALALHGPVSIAIQADQIDFQFYKKGVFEAPCGSNLDHGVLLVGYGTDETTKKDFFIMKNSWGKGWGENGFMRMAQHKGKEGECGLLLSGSYPLVDGEEPPSP